MVRGQGCFVHQYAAALSTVFLHIDPRLEENSTLCLGLQLNSLPPLCQLIKKVMERGGISLTKRATELMVHLISNRFHYD